MASGCETARDPDAEAYPAGRQDNLLTLRYGDDLPMTVYLPAKDAWPAPVVVFNHGRPSNGRGSGTYTLDAHHPFVSALNSAGFAVAVPVRSGYYSAPGPNKESVPCRAPAYSDLRRALIGGREDILDALRSLSALPEVDRSQIFVVGTSAGGFLTLGSLEEFPESVKAVVSFNGGRCGLQGSLIGGIDHTKRLLATAAFRTATPILLVVSTDDEVIPPDSSYAIRDAICEARGPNCGATVFLETAPNASHNFRVTSQSSKDHWLKFLQDRVGE